MTNLPYRELHLDLILIHQEFDSRKNKSFRCLMGAIKTIESF